MFTTILLSSSQEVDHAEYKKLSRSEKLRMMEALWDDLAHDAATLSSPQWHADALKESECAYEEKRTELVSWETAKKFLRDGTT